MQHSSAGGDDSLSAGRAGKVVEALREVGWAVGPPTEPDEWRASVRTVARRAGIRVRTGIARVDWDEPRPWAVDAEQYEALRAAMGGLGADGLGAVLVLTERQRATDRGGSQTVPLRPPRPSQA